MISHSIIKHKPTEVWQTPPRPINNNNLFSFVPGNKSHILNQKLLDEYLLTQPVVGEYVYYQPRGNPNIALRSPHQLYYVYYVENNYGLLTFSPGFGFPETHQLLSVTMGYDNKPLFKFSDSREYPKISKSQYEEFVSDHVQNYIKTTIQSRQAGA